MIAVKPNPVAFVMLSVVAACTPPATSTTPGSGTPNKPPPQDVSADIALEGVPMHMTPDQLPAQFRTQLRDDVKNSNGIAILRQKGSDVDYTFAWEGMTSPVISGHFHKAPHGQVGVRAYSICGVPNDSPACPPGTRASISGTWKNADLEAFRSGQITIAFHTEVYPAPIGEIAVYIPAKR